MRKRRGFSGNAAPTGVRSLLKAMPWPCTFEDILGSIDITVGYRATERTDMGSYRQTLLDDLTTREALLRGEARIDSYHPMTSSLSLFFEDVEECAPTGVQDALCQAMVLDHVENLQLLNRDDLIAFSVLVRYLILEVSALTSNLEMRLCGTLSGFASAMTAFLTTTDRALLASQCSLRGAIEARIRNGVPFAIRQEGLETYINADVRMSAFRWSMLSLRKCLTDDEGIPMSISTQNQMNGLRLALYRAVQLDLEEVPQLLRHNKVFLIFMQVHIFAILPQLDGVPSVRFLEAREANTRDGILLRSKEPFEGLREPVCKHLYGGGGNMLTSLTFESIFQIIHTGERLLLLILCFDHLQHPIIDMSRLSQASHEQAALFLVHVQSVLKCFHAFYHKPLETVCQQCRPPTGGRQFIPIALR